MVFQPDYNNLLDVVNNRKPKRLPLYEHIITDDFIGLYRQKEFQMGHSTLESAVDYFSEYVAFWKEMTYDGIAYEASMCEIYPGHGAIYGGMPGPIQNRSDFKNYPFEEIYDIFWDRYKNQFDALRIVLPKGMKYYGGVGNGIFETSEDLVGYEYLCLMQFDDPELFADLYGKIGEMYIRIWKRLLAEYSDMFVFFRMGDDLGFQTSTLLDPDTFRQYVFPQYKRIIDLVHASGKRFLLHSCGNIFSVMDDLISLGIDAKHSNEDNIAPYDRWIEDYSERIGLVGGIDVNTLCLKPYDEVFEDVYEKAKKFRSMARGYAVGSGNSIPGYVPVEGYKAMVDAVNKIRNEEE